MLLSHGGSQYHLRSRTVRGNPVDHLKRLRSIRKKPRVSNPKPPKLGDEVEQEAVGSDTDTEDSDSEHVRPVFKSMVFGGPPPMLSKPGAAEIQSRKCAERALSDWNETKEPKYELVKAVRSSAKLFRKGLVLHCNFEAKRKDDSEAPVELFFAQLFRPWNERHVGTNICESLGISSSFPDEYEECTDCDICFCGRHPKNLEFMGMAMD